MRRLLVVLIVMLGLTVVGVVSAQDDGEQVEDPTENACYEGGALEGKCDWPTDAEDEWAWACGWYYAAFIGGRIDSAPEWCDILFSKIEPGEPGESLYPICAYVNDPQYYSVMLHYGPNQAGNSTLYGGVSRIALEPCDPSFESSVKSLWVQTPEPIGYTEALQMCADYFQTDEVNASQIDHPKLENFNFVCFEGTPFPF